MTRALKLAGSVAVAAATCFLAYLTAEFFLFLAPDVLLALATGGRIESVRFVPRFPLFLPQVVARFPSSGTGLWGAVRQSSFLVSGLAALALGAMATSRARGWLRLFFAQAVFWAAVFLTLNSGLVPGARNRLSPLFTLLWPSRAQTPELRLAAGGLLALVALVVAIASLRRLLDATTLSRPMRLAAVVGWLWVPACLVGALLVLHLSSWSGLARGNFISIVLLAISAAVMVAGLPAAVWRAPGAPPLHLTLRGAVGVLAVGAVAVAGVFGRAEVSRYMARGQFTQQASALWSLWVEKPAPDQADTASAARIADERLAKLAQRLGVSPPEERLRAYFYTSTDLKQQVAGSDEPFTLEARHAEIHHLLAPDGDVTDARGDARLLMQVAWGGPASEPMARALARYAVGDFHGSALADYAGRITREETPYSLRHVLELDADYLSPLVRDALGGAWVELLVNRRGPAILSRLYREPLAPGREETFAQGLGTSWDGLEREWRSYLLALAERQFSEATPPPERFFHRGISFSHEVGGGWGYGSDSAGRELKRIRSMGANAIAVVPYGFTRAPQRTRLVLATDESDARVIRAIEQAKTTGLRVMLKPQLWGRDFTGHIRFQSDADFDRWFAQYRRWLLHFARMAELYRVDLLVIGTELGGVTDREAAWRGLIADLRRIYRGPLTYAAHWEREFETLRFWDALDYLGVNFYFPLAADEETPQADSATVQDVARRLAALAKKHGKPVLLTEVGYPAARTGAARPWVEDGTLDNEVQRRCYETIFEAIYPQPWLAGLYWWKWPTSGGDYSERVSFVPLGKPAAGVLTRWYGKPDARSRLPSDLLGSRVIQRREEEPR